MIFVSLGTQKFQFNRLLKELDYLVGEKKIENNIFAQIGYSDYQPKNYNYTQFMGIDNYKKIIEECDLVITHGGTGAIVSSLKKRKKIIACPRLKKYEEHVDNHQLEIVDKFMKKNYILSCIDMKNMENTICKLNQIEFKEFKSNSQEFNSKLEEMINEQLVN